MANKRIIQRLLLTLIVIASGLFLPHIARAEGTVTMLEITAYPSKTTYRSGEELDLKDMILTAVYSDGTKQVITDYRVEGYDSSKLGSQVIWLYYQNSMTSVMIQVLPARVSGISQEDLKADYITLTWKPVAGASGYEVYRLDEYNNSSIASSTVTNRAILYDSPAVAHTYSIRAVYDIYGAISYGDYSLPYTTVKEPAAVTGFQVTATTVSSVSLAWDELPGMTGYLLYRAPAGSKQYTYLATAASAAYTDTKVASGTGYRYKVCAYIHKDIYTGGFSQEVSTSTLPASPALKYKAGDQKVRLSWNKVTGASSYKLYIGDDISGYTLLTTNMGNANTTYLAENLENDYSYTFYIVSYREFEGKGYESPASVKHQVQLQQIPATSTTPKYFADREAFEASSAYQELEFFRKNVDYTRSMVIPGLIHTNINGFASTRMCPQGITFAGDYLLMTAYDMASEENSVIYVMDKATGKLLTTLILPVKSHAGGIAFDGTYVWVADGKKASVIPFQEVIAAAESGKPYTPIRFLKSCKLEITASYLTYYDDLLWIGSYDELKATKLNSYYIHDEEDEISLVQVDTINMPNRVQGVAFTEDGYLLLSRSCQIHKGLRGYMRQLDVYRPDLTVTNKGVTPLGKLIRTIEMPSMNEEIALDGGFLYVNFESGAFPKASYIVDRIAAFDLKSVLTQK